MSTKIFVNLPVENLDKSKEFFTKLGYSFNPQFTDEKAACLVISDDIYFMLVTKPFFQTFTKKEIIDTKNKIETMTAISAESKERVDEIVNKALAAGGKETRAPQDESFMYGRSFEDLDGHTWEIIWMDPTHIQGNQ